MRFACELQKRTLCARFWALLDAQYLSVGTSPVRRLQVGFTPDQRSALAERARRDGLSLSAAVRRLVSAALSLEPAVSPEADSPAALAALTAAEHAVLMVASILPEGERRMHSLSQRAAEAAEKRLALFRDQVAASGEVSP